MGDGIKSCSEVQEDEDGKDQFENDCIIIIIVLYYVHFSPLTLVFPIKCDRSGLTALTLPQKT